MKYIIIWALMNINTGSLEGPYLDSSKKYTAVECTQAILNKGVQKPEKDGRIKVFECTTDPGKISVQYVEEI